MSFLAALDPDAPPCGTASVGEVEDGMRTLSVPHTLADAPDAETLHRHVLWTIYLNDGFDAGETEFLFQQRKIAPRTGDLLIAPTAFTHTHRGNKPQNGDKFIATSWILFQRAETLYGG